MAQKSFFTSSCASLLTLDNTFLRDMACLGVGQRVHGVRAVAQSRIPRVATATFPR